MSMDDPPDTQDEAAQAAEAHRDADKEAEEKVAALEDDPPEELEDWPDDKAKYKTFGGPEGDTGYEEGPTAQLGEADVRHHEDGSVTVGGEKVDDPDQYKGEPIPGGPTDPNSASLSGERDLTDKDDDEHEE